MLAITHNHAQKNTLHHVAPLSLPNFHPAQALVKFLPLAVHETQQDCVDLLALLKQLILLTLVIAFLKMLPQVVDCSHKSPAKPVDAMTVLVRSGIDRLLDNLVKGCLD